MTVLAYGTHAHARPRTVRHSMCYFMFHVLASQLQASNHAEGPRGAAASATGDPPPPKDVQAPRAPPRPHGQHQSTALPPHTAQAQLGREDCHLISNIILFDFI